MFNEEKWKNFSQKQPALAKDTKRLTKEEMVFLLSKTPESDMSRVRVFKKYHEILREQGIFHGTDTLLQDLYSLLRA